MGNKISRPGQQPPPFSGIPGQQPQVSGIIDLSFIPVNPPTLPQLPAPAPAPANKAQNREILTNIMKLMTDYNKNAWNFGNNQNTGAPQSLLKPEIYTSFLSFVANLIDSTKQYIPPTDLKNINKNSFEGKKIIVKKINESIGKRFPLVNQFFSVKLSVIFPDIPGIKVDDSINVTLLGLAAIIGAEHLVIYFLMCGANPTLTYAAENRDSATLTLTYQLALSKLSVNSKYFIILPRILYILFLLGSVGVGVDLSAIFESNELKNKVNLSGTQTVTNKTSILNMLAQSTSSFTNNTKNQTLQNGGSIPLLLEILEMNNSLESPKFFVEINSVETPYNYTVLYNVLMNPLIDDEIKLRLVELLVIKYSANITIVPTNIIQKSQLDTFNIILLIVHDKIPTNSPNTKASILQIFSKNQEFKIMLEKSNIDLSQFTSQNPNTNKNKIIEALTIQVNLLKNSIGLFQKAQQGKVAANILSAQVNALQRQARVQAGGKQIQMRTFHFLKYKKYSERAFIAERPIIAADNAYDFMKLHYNIRNKQVTFTIHDRVNNKKYKYVAKTLKDGTDVIKSAK